MPSVPKTIHLRSTQLTPTVCPALLPVDDKKMNKVSPLFPSSSPMKLLDIKNKYIYIYVNETVMGWDRWMYRSIKKKNRSEDFSEEKVTYEIDLKR